MRGKGEYMAQIEDIRLRRILNSNADWTVEAEVFLKDGSWGRGTSPMAIVSGKREKRITDRVSIEKLNVLEAKLKRQLVERDFDQQRLDAYLNTELNEIGTGVSLALSLAFAKAVSSYLNMNFVEYLSKQINNCLGLAIPRILVPVFSGGVHSKKSENRDSFQQIMVCISGGGLEEKYKISKELSCITEEQLMKRSKDFIVAASGGYVVESLTSTERLELLQEILAIANCADTVDIAVDVAAEHLYHGRGYFYDGKIRSSEEFLEIMQECVMKYKLCYIEDPFITEDSRCWKILKKSCGDRARIIGDDLFATQRENINPILAHGVVVKMNQVGNLSDTAAAIKETRRNKMDICVSHRSYETEDTTMCDLAVACAAEYIKIGGVKRGERLIKYNQLLRLEELVNYC